MSIRSIRKIVLHDSRDSDEGGGDEDDGDHDEAVDQIILQAVPPRPEGLLRLAVAQHLAEQS